MAIEVITPDFDALRAERNAAVYELVQRFADEEGVPVDALRTTFDPNACYCACGSGGLCEHTWDGPVWVSEDGCTESATCARCGCTAMSHDMRTLP